MICGREINNNNRVNVYEGFCRVMVWCYGLVGFYRKIYYLF